MREMRLLNRILTSANKSNAKSAADIERAAQSLEGDSKRVTVDRIIAGEDGNLTTEERRNRIARIKDTDVPGVADKNPITGPILKSARDSLPKTNESISAEEQEDRHLIRKVETTGEDIDLRNSPNEASREILTRLVLILANMRILVVSIKIFLVDPHLQLKETL